SVRVCMVGLLEPREHLRQTRYAGCRGPGRTRPSGFCQTLPERTRRALSCLMSPLDHRAEVREFLTSRRARITPEQAGLLAYGGNRRVQGLRREEVAMLAGVSVDYYIRLERGNLSGASGSVLEALARALQLDAAEQKHLFSLARSAAKGPARRRTPPAAVR